MTGGTPSTSLPLAAEGGGQRSARRVLVLAGEEQAAPGVGQEALVTLRGPAALPDQQLVHLGGVGGPDDVGGLAGVEAQRGDRGQVGDEAPHVGGAALGAAATSAIGVNDHGLIVGWYAVSPTTTVFHGFADQGGTITTIDVPGASSTTVTGVGDRGQIVGWYVNAAGEHGFEVSPAA